MFLWWVIFGSLHFFVSHLTNIFIDKIDGKRTSLKWDELIEKLKE